MKSLVPLLFCAVNLAVAQPFFEPFPAVVRSGLFRALPHDRDALIVSLDDYDYSTLPVEPFLPVQKNIRFVVLADGEGPAAVKMLLLPEKTSDSMDAFQASANETDNINGDPMRVLFDRHCLAFSEVEQDGFCRVENLELKKTAAGLVVRGFYGLSESKRWRGHLASEFQRVPGHFYRDIIWVKQSLPARRAPDYLSPIHYAFPEKSYLAVVVKLHEWLMVDRYDGDGTHETAWVARRDLVDGTWILQGARTAAHSFRVAYRPFDENIGGWNGIEITSLATGKVQYILDQEGEDQSGDGAKVLHLHDVDFDGHPDLVLAQQNGGAGPDSTQSYFLFDPVTDEYVFNKVLSEMPQLFFDSAKKTVSSAWRNGACEHGWELHRWSGNRLVKFREGSDRCEPSGAGDFSKVTVRWLAKGKWHTRIRFKR